MSGPRGNATTTPAAWSCPICGGTASADRFSVRSNGTEAGVSADAFRPTSSDFGSTTGRLVRCLACGHGSIAQFPSAAEVASAYASAVDETALAEERGQAATAHRALDRIEEVTAPGRLLDVGCWTGSFLVAARARGWQPCGVEPSRWAAEQARKRGLDIRGAELGDDGLADASFDVVVVEDVLEHLADPAAAVRRVSALLDSRGLLYVTGPDAGSAVARLLGPRWWSVLPMHLQYFTRSTMGRLLDDNGFEILLMTSHPKVFTAGYYADRLGDFLPPLGRAARALVGGARWADRLVAPNLHDRMAVLARRR